ncbi:MAG TPA: hypothetical protein DEV81_22035 [Cyanobacteria bacterium UBA11049]|nr:hypothetical protein [Cyanobacteria bacterium UBA11049]
MLDLFRWSSTKASAVLLTFGMTAGAVTPIITSVPASAQSTAPTTSPSLTPSPVASPSPTSAATFSDVGANYWAQPFIQALAQRNIITGFVDGTFKLDRSVDRAGFAAMIQKAFNQNQVRQLSAGGFKDVPSGYWAAAAIKSAYETGFMDGYPNGLFQPSQEISKVQAIAALASGLNLNARGSAINIVSSYYTDPVAIPTYAVDEVAAATQANVVVNYPNLKQLNPLKPLTRAEAAAHLYQALVHLGQIPPIASNVTAANYIVGRTTNVGQTTPTTPTTGSSATATTATTPSTETGAVGNIYTLAASQFTTLASLLKATGLAESLQKRGPYTVFAPTDRAFAALPKATLQQLQKPENSAALMKILMYHVVPGELTANELSSGKLKTLEGSAINLKVNSAANQVAVNDATVIQPNIQASNGAIHAVDEVLVPPNLNLNKLGQ